jgi:hypothetical protein
MTPLHLQKSDSCDLSTSNTRSNNLLAILEDYDPGNDDDEIADNLTVQASNRTYDTTLGISRQQLRQPAWHRTTPMVLSNPLASPVHDLWPTTTPTLIPQPRLPLSTCQLLIAIPATIEPQHLF